MTDAADAAGGPTHRSAEIAVAVGLAVLAAIGILGSLRAGVGWAAEGPEAGFFPFYVSLIVLVSCAINLVNVLRERRSGKIFAEWGQLRQVAAVVIPTTAYVFLVGYIGIYVASALLIAVFMKWFGRYGWAFIVLIAVGVPVATFILFEHWFLVPLPKGPVENWLGL